MRRVLIVGAGVTCAAGTGTAAFWDGLMSGRSFGELVEFDGTDVRAVATCVKDAELEGKLSTSEARRLDRIEHLAIVAADEAVANGGCDLAAVPGERRGMVVGVGFGGISTLTRQHDVLRDRGWKKLSPFSLPAVMPSGTAGFLSIRYGIGGPVATVSSACASGTQAIGDAYRLVASGAAEVVLAGGAEAPLDPLPIGAFSRMDAMTQRFDDPGGASRPFDRARDGFVIGEGAAFVLLATDDAAKAMGSPVYGEVVGYGLTTDAYHIAAPLDTGEAAVRCITSALAEANVSFASLSHVNAHGTSTKLNDAAEASALLVVAGDVAPPVTVALKGAIGHLMGAAGAVEFVASVMALGRGKLPPTVNFEMPDEGMTLDISSEPREIRTDAAFLSTSFGFGGQNAAVVVRPLT